MFLSGIIALLLAGVLSSFYIYQYIRRNEAPELENLRMVIPALGIGVVPYAVSKFREWEPNSAAYVFVFCFCLLTFEWPDLCFRLWVFFLYLKNPYCKLR